MRTIDLAFDRHNPRLVEFDITSKTTDEEMIQLLWNVMDVHELVLSIAASGFFPYEALLVAEEAGKNIVIEGNRRLAAVRILLEPGIVDSGYVTIPKLSVEVRDSLHELPVLVGSAKTLGVISGLNGTHCTSCQCWSARAKTLGVISGLNMSTGQPSGAATPSLATSPTCIGSTTYHSTT